MVRRVLERGTRHLSAIRGVLRALFLLRGEGAAVQFDSDYSGGDGASGFFFAGEWVLWGGWWGVKRARILLMMGALGGRGKGEG